MFDITGLDTPTWGDRESGTKFVIETLKVWTEALASYTGKSDKGSTKVSKVVDAITATDEEAVNLADRAMDEIRSIILDCVTENVNTTYLLFSALDDVKKSIGSWRADVNVTVEDDEDTEEDRNLVEEYEALDKGRTMIEGTFNAFGLNVLDLPEKYRAQKMERINGKNVPTGNWYLKFPGKLVSPLNENEGGKTGKAPVSMTYTWTLATSEGETDIGKASWPYLARFCSTSQVIIGTDDLLTSVKARYGDSFAGEETIEVRTPRGILHGTKVKK